VEDRPVITDAAGKRHKRSGLTCPSDLLTFIHAMRPLPNDDGQSISPGLIRTVVRCGEGRPGRRTTFGKIVWLSTTC
jgi:hypothetical protein